MSAESDLAGLADIREELAAQRQLVEDLERARDAKIVAAAAAGLRVPHILDAAGITRARLYQILDKAKAKR